MAHAAPNPPAYTACLPKKAPYNPLGEIVVMCELVAVDNDLFFLSLDPDDGRVISDRMIDHLDDDGR